jgi:hypothetical protein
MRWDLLGMTMVSTSLVATTANADKMAKTLDISLSTRAAWLQIHREMHVAPGAEGADLLTSSRPHLHGVGPLTGGTGRIGVTLDGVRLGYGVGFVSAANLDFLHEPLGDGLSADPGAIWGVPIEGYLGYAMGDPNEIRGLLEVRGAFTILQTRVTLKDEVLGNLGDTPFNVYLGSLELRMGVRLPIGKVAYFEAGLGISPLPVELGPERGSLFFTLGLPVPTVNAF